MKYLEVYFNGDLKHSFPIEADVISIGRAQNNDVIIDNKGVSNLHAIISNKKGQFYVEDLNSTNGTFLNNQKISSNQKINLKDTLTIGKHNLKISEWSQSKTATPVSSFQDSSDETVMMSRRKDVSNTAEDAEVLQQKQCYLLVRGESTGIKKLLLTENNYTIGKAKDNDIRVGGWFTAAYIAEIEKVGHSYYINPLKRGKVKLNHNALNSSTLLSASDEMRIKNLFLKFITD